MRPIITPMPMTRPMVPRVEPKLVVMAWITASGAIPAARPAMEAAMTKARTAWILVRMTKKMSRATAAVRPTSAPISEASSPFMVVLLVVWIRGVRPTQATNSRWN